MPSDAAMRTAKAIKATGYFVDYIGRDAPDEWIDNIAQIIDRESASGPPKCCKCERDATIRYCDQTPPFAMFYFCDEHKLPIVHIEKGESCPS